MGEMWQAFYSTKLTMFNVGSQNGGVGRIVNGSGAVVVALILAILLGAFLLEKGRRRRGIAWFSLWSTLGFAAYYIFIGFTYVYVFSEAGRNDGLQPLYLPLLYGLAAGGACHFCGGAAACKARCADALGAAGADGVCAWRVATFVPAELTVLNDLTGALSERTKNTESVEQAKALLTRGRQGVLYRHAGQRHQLVHGQLRVLSRSACGLQLRRRQLDGYHPDAQH